MKNKLLGFSLIELLITISVLIVLGVIAIPAYQDYIRRLYYTDILQSAIPFKEKVVECYKKRKMLKGCSAGFYAIPPAIVTATKGVASLDVVHGVITLHPVESKGVKVTDIYVMTPAISNNGELSWESSGDAVVRGYAK